MGICLLLSRLVFWMSVLGLWVSCKGSFGFVRYCYLIFPMPDECSVLNLVEISISASAFGQWLELVR